MFGGLTFMVHDNMACGIVGKDLMVRVGPEHYEEGLSRPHARPMDFTGRPLKGMVYVGPEGCKTDESLQWWVDQAVAFLASVPGGKSKAQATRGGRGVKSGTRIFPRA